MHSNRYIPPLERVRRRNLRWRPKQVALEEKLQRQCDQGKLIPFRQPAEYTCIYIHRNTSIDIIDTLIDEAKATIHYTIDTEDDIGNHQGALIQIEFITTYLPRIIIIVETQYLSSR